MASSTYATVITAILLFPWSLVGLMIVGAVRKRRKVRAQVRP